MCDIPGNFHIPGNCPSPDAAGLGHSELLKDLTEEAKNRLLDMATVKAKPKQVWTEQTGDVEVRIELLPHGVGLQLPMYATAGSAGLDLYAALDPDEEILLQPGSRMLVPTGFKMAVPAGYEAQVRSRSGLALKAGVVVLNSPGTIDSDYRGEVGVILANLGPIPAPIKRGDRIAQLVLARCVRAKMRLAPLDTTERGEGGFGSTGK